MQILKIKLTQDEEDRIFNELIRRFELISEKQVISADNREITWESSLELYTEMSDFDGNNQTSIMSRSVLKFDLTFYHDGDQVEAVMNNKSGECINDRIEKYYSI
ncbi:MAG: hypothetical protein Q8T08_07195 [Ignavibacteria bacterium]|nr:hypothetical protein [Ignavibacteria bacterium]